MPNLKQLLNKYSPKDNFNADECGIFVVWHPIVPLLQKHFWGEKKAENIITNLSCENADSIEKRELMVIASSKMPKAFEKNQVKIVALTITRIGWLG